VAAPFLACCSIVALSLSRVCVRVAAIHTRTHPLSLTHARTMDKKQNKDLHKACSKGDVPGIKKAIAAGADVNLADKKGNAALHMAVESGALDACKALLEAGADPRHKNAKGLTPAEYADKKKKKNLVQVLREYEAGGGYAFMCSSCDDGDDGSLTCLPEASAPCARPPSLCTRTRPSNGSSSMRRWFRSSSSSACTRSRTASLARPPPRYVLASSSPPFCRRSDVAC